MRTLLLAAAFSAIAAAVSAQPLAMPGGYVSFSGARVGDGETSVDFANAVARAEIEMEEGGSAQLAFGTRSTNWRLEAAVSVRQQDASVVFTSPPGGPVVGGIGTSQIEVRALDLNGYFDLPTGTIVRPYVGAGFGIAEVDLGNIVRDESSSLHLQAIGGVSADVSPRVAVFAEARFERVGDFAVETHWTQPDGTQLDGEDEISFTNTQLAAGVRFSF